MDILRPILDQLAKIWARLNLMPVIRWGTVTQADPLRVQLDGDTEPLLFTPQNPLGKLNVSQRVLCVEVHRRVIIIQKKHDDTGWVDLSGYFLSGFSGGFEGRRVGDTVELQFSISGTIPSSSGSTNFTNSIPETFRPGTRNTWGAAYFTGYTGSAFIRPDGTLAMANRSGASWTGGQSTITSR